MAFETHTAEHVTMAETSLGDLQEHTLAVDAFQFLEPCKGAARILPGESVRMCPYERLGQLGPIWAAQRVRAKDRDRILLNYLVPQLFQSFRGRTVGRPQEPYHFTKKTHLSVTARAFIATRSVTVCEDP